MKLFPGCSSSSDEPNWDVRGKHKFDPSAECVASEQQKKKKACNDGKPRTIPVVLLQEKQAFVPKGHARTKLNKAGRVVKVDFRRNMSSREVRNAIVQQLPNFDNIVAAQFLRCGQDNRLWLNSLHAYITQSRGCPYA